MSRRSPGCNRATYPERICHHEPLDQQTLKFAEARRRLPILWYHGNRHQCRHICEYVSQGGVENQSVDCCIGVNLGPDKHDASQLTFPEKGKVDECADDYAGAYDGKH